MRLLPILLGLGATSCSVRLGSEARPVSSPPSTPPLARPGPPRPPLRPRVLGRRIPRSTTPTTPRPSPSPNDSSVAQLCVDEINRYRATLGLRPLERAADREACADDQIRDDAHSGHWHGRFGACSESMQNECNASTSDRADMIKGCLKGMWGEGPGGGHYENMKSAGATKVWCGFYTTPSGGVWSVQDFK